MPEIGIIRGFGEGYIATGYIIKIIRALKKRFRSKISFCEIPAGDYMQHGCDLKTEAVNAMKQSDAIFAGDMISRVNPIEYGIEDIAMALSNDIEYTCISGIGKGSSVDIRIASYFDGGFRLRDGERKIDGCRETRVCSAYSATNIVKFISRECENRRRRLAFIKDGDNEYCADLFYSKFENFTLPLSNFHLIKFSLKDISSEILYDPSQFDTIFASKTFADMAVGMYKMILNEHFASYNKFSRQKPVYYVNGLCENSGCGTSVPSIASYIVAFCDLLEHEFNLQKEAVSLRLSLEDVIEKGIDSEDGEAFTSEIIKALDRPVATKYLKNAPKSRYIR